MHDERNQLQIKNYELRISSSKNLCFRLLGLKIKN